MYLTPRQRKILLFLLSSDHPMTSEQLANEIEVSKRTIQRECDSIEFQLRNSPLTLVKRKRIGLFIDGDPETISKLQQSLLSENELDATNINQRRMYLLLELLRDRTPKKRIYFADKLNVSEATISNDMEAIQEWMKKNNLKIVSKPGYGIMLEGSESDYREALRRFIDNFVKTENTRSKRELLVDALVDNSNKGIYSLLSSNVIRKVERVLENMKDPKLETLTDEAYVSLVIHIAISIVRIREGSIVEKNEDELEMLKTYEDYDLAVRVLHAMELEFNLKIPKVEISYLLLHIEGSKINYSRTKDINEILNINEEQIMHLVNDMTDVFDPGLSEQLKQDKIFTRGLIVHLQPVLVRLKNHMNIFNPLLEDIKSEYPDIFKKCQVTAQVITKYTGLHVTEEEVGYLTMHFGAACERLKNEKRFTRDVSIGVVCASGFGVARLMMTKLHNQLPEGVNLYPFGKEDLETDAIQDIDFFVTSFNLDTIDIDYIQVNPLIRNEDIEQIEHKIEDYSHIHKKTKEQKQQTTQVHASYLVDQIHRIVDGFDQFRVQDTVTFDEVLDFLSQQIGADASAKDAIVETLKKRESMYTQVLPDLGIALFHGVTAGVKEISFHVCVTNEQEFKDPFFQGIQAIIIMMIPNDARLMLNTEMMGYVSSSLINKKQFLNVIKYGSQEAIQTELKSILQEFFFEYVEKNGI